MTKRDLEQGDMYG